MLTAFLLIPHMSELTGIDARLFPSKSPTDWELERPRLFATVFLDHDTLRAGLVNSWQTKLGRSGFPRSSMETGGLMKDRLASPLCGTKSNRIVGCQLPSPASSTNWM